jgi:hypothetical protein
VTVVLQGLCLHYNSFIVNGIIFRGRSAARSGVSQEGGGGVVGGSTNQGARPAYTSSGGISISTS